VRDDQVPPSLIVPLKTPVFPLRGFLFYAAFALLLSAGIDHLEQDMRPLINRHTLPAWRAR
jgi:hypothetical protein